MIIGLIGIGLMVFGLTVLALVIKWTTDKRR